MIASVSSSSSSAAWFGRRLSIYEKCRRPLCRLSLERPWYGTTTTKTFSTDTTTTTKNKDKTTATTTSTTPAVPQQQQQQLLFYVPKAERGNRNVFDIDYLVGETRLYRDKRTCPTRELNFEHTKWGRHKSPYRKFRHISNLFRAAGFQRLLFPDLFCVSTVAGCLTYYNEIVVVVALASSSGATNMLSMSPTAFAGATTAIGLLAGFRLNNSYERYKEARNVWGTVNTAIRDLTRQTMMWMKDKTNNDQSSSSLSSSSLKRQQVRMLNLCQAFPIALLFHQNDKGSHHNMKRKSKIGEGTFQERVQAEFEAELYDCKNYTYHQEKDGTTILLFDNKEDLERICRVKAQGGNAPLEVITCMAEVLATCGDAPHDTMNPIYIRELDQQVQRLCLAVGGSEKLLKTPLPTGFTRHSSRLLFIWSNCLPFALYPLLGPLGTLPTTLLTSYAVLGIEDISVQLEEPFDILPLRQYSDGIVDSVQSIEGSFFPAPAAAEGTPKHKEI